ncbi:MAG: AI-2E family transporter [Lachnospiraceae bacterium]|nr:AI-2E family transporter [Lachnospiraceae bacterium]
MKRNRFGDREWYPLAVAICIGVLFYFLLMHLDVVWTIIRNIAYFVYPVIAGAIIAYLMNPLMRLLENKPFRKLKSATLRRVLSLIITIIVIYTFITVIFIMLIPQLYESAMTLYNNKDSYMEALSAWVSERGIGSALSKYYDGVNIKTGSIMEFVISYISDNGGSIMDRLSTVGGHIGAWVIGIVFSVYFLAEKDKISNFLLRLLRACQKNEEKSSHLLMHLKKIDAILTRYMMFSIIDSIIIGTLTAIIMAVCRMQYVGLISVIVGVTNLIPTFGPMIGAGVGGLILLFVNPMHALIFLIFALGIQTFDGWVLKPKLFGESFGISGLWILVAIIVGGRIFGVLGIILAIPFVAIADYLINDVYLPYRKTKNVSEGPEEEMSGLSKEDKQEQTTGKNK